jgi:hypothetical protein
LRIDQETEKAARAHKGCSAKEKKGPQIFLLLAYGKLRPDKNTVSIFYKNINKGKKVKLSL